MAEVLIGIELTPESASKIRLMVEAGVFHLHTGNATLNFHEGVLKSIKTEVFTYPSVENTYPQNNIHKVDMKKISPTM